MHLDMVRHDEEMGKIVEIESLFNDIDDVYESCNREAEEYGNASAEWHYYEMACGDAISEIIKILYKKGYLRIGESKDGLHFEGFPDTIRDRYQKCKDFAEQYDKRAIFEPQKESMFEVQNGWRWG